VLLDKPEDAVAVESLEDKDVPVANKLEDEEDPGPELDAGGDVDGVDAEVRAIGEDDVANL
jgi:hypothetical protein